MEQEIVQIREAIREADARAATEKAAADRLRADMRESGVDFAKDKDAFEKIDAAYKGYDSARDEAAELRARADRLMQIAGEKATETKDSVQRREARAAVADVLLRSDAYQHQMARLGATPGGTSIRSGVRIEMDPVEALTRDETMDFLRLRTLITSAAGSGGGMIWSDRKDLVVMKPERSVRLLDVITIGSTDSDTVEWTEETTRTHAAAEFAPGSTTNAVTNTEGLWPNEAAYGFTKASATVKDLGHWVPSTKKAFADAGQLRTLVNGALRKGVLLRVEAQTLAGDGTGNNFAGIVPNAGIGSIALGTDSRFDAVHKAITNVRVNTEGDEPGHIGIHPNDWEDLVLEKDADGNYVHGRAAVEMNSIWGLTPIISTVFTAGTVLIGAYDNATLWVREGVSLSASDSHLDFFLKELVAVKANMRAAFAVTQPKGFCKITGF